MKTRHLVAGATGIALGALAVRYLRRPTDVEWLRHAHELPHAELSRFAVIDGVRMHYQEAGDPNAPVILLMHGFASSCIVWSRVLVHIAHRGFRVIAPDMIGFGFSEKPDHPDYTIEWQARSMIALMDQLNIESAIVVGSSYGGAVAATCALDFPDRVKRLVMVGAVINNAPLSQPLVRLSSSPIIGDILTPILLDSRLVVRKRVRRFYAEGNEATDERIEGFHRPLRVANTHRSVLKTARRWDATRISRDAEDIMQPTLLIWGEDDQDIPVTNGQFMLNAMPNARMYVLKNCGHLPHEEWPREFVDILTDFCRDEVPLERDRTYVMQPEDSANEYPTNAAHLVMQD